LFVVEEGRIIEPKESINDNSFLINMGVDRILRLMDRVSSRGAVTFLERITGVVPC